MYRYAIQVQSTDRSLNIHKVICLKKSLWHPSDTEFRDGLQDSENTSVDCTPARLDFPRRSPPLTPAWPFARSWRKALVSSIPQKGAIDLPEALGRLIDLQAATNKLDEVKMWPDE